MEASLTAEDVGKHYDRLAAAVRGREAGAIHFGYWEQDGQGTLEQAVERHTGLVLARTGLRAGERLLDVGCGYGQSARRAAREHGVHVTGITNSAEQRAVAERAAQREEPDVAERLSFDFGDAARLPYPDASFDAAWAIESLLHMPDPGAVLAEIHRVLVPGGRLVVADVVEHTAMPPELRRLWRESMLSVPLDADAFPGMLAAAGFEAVGVEDLTARTRHHWQALAESFARPPFGRRGAGGDGAADARRDAFARRMVVDLPRLGSAFDDHLFYVLVRARR